MFVMLCYVHIVEFVFCRLVRALVWLCVVVVVVVVVDVMLLMLLMLFIVRNSFYNICA